MPDRAHLISYRPGDTEPAMVLLHGSDGRESDLLPLAEQLAPRAPKLAVRGTVVMPGGYAFVRRRPDRSLDEADISTRAAILADDIRAAVSERALFQPPVAVGYSNGAIMAAALLLTEPHLLTGAILFRPQPPFSDDRPAELSGVPVLIIDGREDPRRHFGQGRELAEQLRQDGAQVSHHELTTGHAITTEDLDLAQN